MQIILKELDKLVSQIEEINSVKLEELEELEILDGDTRDFGRVKIHWSD